MKIIFVRHGENNIKTNKLTLRGKIQTLEALRYIRNEKVEAIYCSPRTRALQTANILNKKLNLPLFIIKEFSERKMLSPQQKVEHGAEFDENYLNYNFSSDKFETCKKFVDRVCEGMKNILKKYKEEKTILIVAHSSTLYALNAFLNGVPKDGHIRWWQCNNGAVIKFFV